MLSHKFKPVFKVIKNKYVVTTIAFLVWMIFFDPKDWGLMLTRAKKYKDLKQSEQHLTQQIVDTRKELSLLNTDAASIEKYAREHFYMKKENEDLFIVKTK